MEVLRTLKGPSTGEVSVHLVARDSPGSGPHLPATAFIIPGRSSSGLGRRNITIPAKAGVNPREKVTLAFHFLLPSFTCLHKW